MTGAEHATLFCVWRADMCTPGLVPTFHASVLCDRCERFVSSVDEDGDCESCVEARADGSGCDRGPSTDLVRACAEARRFK